MDGWPAFDWDRQDLANRLAAIRHRQGRLLGRMESLGLDLQATAVLQTLTEDVLKSSEIEGEILDKEQVRSSIARRLGMGIGALAPVDRHVEGVVEMILDATQSYLEPLSEERLFAWHAALFPTGRNSARSSIFCSRGSRASSPPRSGRSSPRPRPTRRCATSTTSWLEAS